MQGTTRLNGSLLVLASVAASTATMAAEPGARDAERVTADRSDSQAPVLLPASNPSPRSRAIALDAGFSIGAQDPRLGDGSWAFSGYLDTTLLYRPSRLTLGLGADLGGAPGQSSQEFLGALGGTTWVPASWMRIDTLAELGVHVEQPSEMDLFGSRNRVVGGDKSFSLPYAGVHISPAFLIGRKAHRFLIGAWFDARQDLAHKNAQFTVESCGNGFLGDYSCGTFADSYEAGGLHLTAGIRLGAEFGPAVPD